MTQYLQVPGGAKIITSDPLETSGPRGQPPQSVTIQHTNPKKMANRGYVVPIPIVTMFMEGNRVCNKCQVKHDVKHVHLDLDENARCMVSWGVYKELRMGGFPHLQVVNTVARPPTLILSPKLSRRQVDHENLKQTIHTG